jgi:organic radical activating enzyme
MQKPSNPDPKSAFMSAAETMQYRLGPSLCLAKWQQTSLHLTTGHTNSCYHPPLHRIDPTELQEDPSALHNTSYKKQQRKIMLRNERPAECNYCWNIEDTGNLSDRHYRSGEPWAAMDLERLRQSTGDENVIPRYVEVNFNTACNLKCSYCSPQFSSSWMDEAQRHGAYPTGVPHNDPAHFSGDRRPIPSRESNPYLDAFWQWWPQLYPQLRHFRMTGGEPLMDRNTYRVFDYVLAAPHPELHLNVTSNFSVTEELFDRYLSYVQRICATPIEHFMQYVSLDTGDWAQAEYIRHGLDAGLLMSRVSRFLDEVPQRNSLTFIITLNNLSVPGLDRLLDWILELRARHSRTYQRVWFDTPLLRQPRWQSLQILPVSYQQRMQQHLEFMKLNAMPEGSFVGFKDYEIQRMERDIAWMSLPQDPQEVQQARADFYRFFREHDRRRGTDFVAVFPEMRSFWQECKHHAR